MPELRKVHSGEPLVIPAATFNTFVDTAQDYLSRRSNVSQTPKPLGQQAGIILLKNASGSDLPRFSTLALYGPLIYPESNKDAFASRLGMCGLIADVATPPGCLAVLQEPIPADGIGLAIAGGVTIATVNVTDAEHTHADITEMSTVLASCQSGAAQILWKPESTGEVLCIVRLGNSVQPQLPSNAGKTKHMMLTLKDSNATAVDDPELLSWDFERFI